MPQPRKKGSTGVLVAVGVLATIGVGVVAALVLAPKPATPKPEDKPPPSPRPPLENAPAPGQMLAENGVAPVEEAPMYTGPTVPDPRPTAPVVTVEHTPSPPVPMYAESAPVPATPPPAPKPPSPKPPPSIPATVPEAIAATTAAVQAGLDAMAQANNPSAPPPPAPPPLVVQESENESVELARLLLAAQNGANWKTALQDEVRSWQTSQGLSADGKFGPGSAYEMVRDGVGVLPRIRYWPLGSASKSAALQKYRSELTGMAAQLEREGKDAQAVAVRASAAAEQGEGWPTKPSAISKSTQQKDSEALKAALEEMEAVRRRTLEGIPK